MSWASTDGQKGTLSFTQNTRVGILPRQKESGQDDIQLVEFKGFAMTGKEEALGTFRYKKNPKDKQREIKPGQLGPCVL